MKLGGIQIVTCPFCGKEKELMEILSGNGIGAVQWSDNKVNAPMMPEISFVQKCPGCGKYYVRRWENTSFDRKKRSIETGELSYLEMKEAFAQLKEEGFKEYKEEAKVRMMLHHAYNDYYYRSRERREVQPDDWKLFRENALWLIEHVIEEDVLKAEFYREIGEMEKAKSILDTAVVDWDFVKKIVYEIRKRVEQNDCVVFQVE